MGENKYTSEQIEIIITTMEDYGGSFVHNLAKLYNLADSENKKKLVICFKNYFDKYYNNFVIVKTEKEG